MLVFKSCPSVVVDVADDAAAVDDAAVDDAAVVDAVGVVVVVGAISSRCSHPRLGQCSFVRYSGHNDKHQLFIPVASALSVCLLSH